MALMTANVINLTAQAMIEVLAIHYRIKTIEFLLHGGQEGRN